MKRAPQPVDDAHKAAHSRWQASMRREASQMPRRRCALVVDDEPDGRDALALLLQRSGFEVHTSDNGEDALRAADRYQPGLIILDIGMPGLNGYDVCRRLRRSASFAHASIIALSGFSGELHDTRCSEAGFTAQLSKPFDPAALERVMNRSLS